MTRPRTRAAMASGGRAQTQLARARRLLRSGSSCARPGKYARPSRRLPPCASRRRATASVLGVSGLSASMCRRDPLRRFLRDRPDDPNGWELGRNLGPRAGVFEAAASGYA